MKKIVIITVVLSFAFLCFACAEEARLIEFQSIEYLFGWGSAPLKEKSDYCFIPLVIGLDFNFKPLVKKLGINPYGLVQFQIEPFLSNIYQPNANLEAGNSFFLKLGLLPDNYRIQPFIKGGLGLIWMSQHTREQSTQFNFLVNGGAGLHYFFTRDNAFTLEYRYRHLSNSSIKQPNSGINAQVVIAGIAKFF